MFNSFIREITNPGIQNGIDINVNTISVYPISEGNLEGIKILIDNCTRVGSDSNINVEVATVSPSIWLGDFLDNNWRYIHYVVKNLAFKILKVGSDNRIISVYYKCDSKEFNSEDDLNLFLRSSNWKRLAIFSVVKYVDLSNFSTMFVLKYADITEKFEERDNKISDILKIDDLDGDMPF